MIIQPFSFMQQRVETATLGPVTDTIKLYLDASNASSYPGSGNTWYDLSGNGNNGTISGTLTYASSSLVWGSINTANYVTVTHASSLSVFDGDFTVDFWYAVSSSVTNIANDNFGFWFKGAAFSSNPGIGNLMNRYTSAGDFKQGAYYVNNSLIPGQNYLTQDGASFVFNKWYNLQYVRSGTSVKIYSGGTEIRSATNSPVSNANNTSNITIGKYGAAAGGFWGKIGTLLIYDKALSTTELTQNYNYYNAIFV